MTELDMSRVNEWLDTVRNTFINASELAKSVASLQEQVNSMSMTLDGLRRTNTTLEENLAWSRSERERLETDLRQSQNKQLDNYNALVQAERDRDNYKTISEERASIIATLRSDNDAIAFKNLELEEENAKLKAIVDGMQKLLGPIALIDSKANLVQEAPKTETVSEPKVVPYVHPVTGAVQGRDTETQQFKPAPQDQPKTEEKPWWMDEQDKQFSGF